MGHYQTLKESLDEEISGETPYTLVMSPETLSNLMGDGEFLDRLVDGGTEYPSIKFVWFETDQGNFVFPIDLDSNMPLGRVDTREHVGDRPTIYFP